MRPSLVQGELALPGEPWEGWAGHAPCAGRAWHGCSGAICVSTRLRAEALGVIHFSRMLDRVHGDSRNIAPNSTLLCVFPGSSGEPEHIPSLSTTLSAWSDLGCALSFQATVEGQHSTAGWLGLWRCAGQTLPGEEAAPLWSKSMSS